MPRQPAPCGTRAAYVRHLRNNEEPCDPCKAANAAHARPGNAARQRAWKRLADLHPKDYARLLAEETAKETEEGDPC